MSGTEMLVNWQGKYEELREKALKLLESLETPHPTPGCSVCIDCENLLSELSQTLREGDEEDE